MCSIFPLVFSRLLLRSGGDVKSLYGSMGIIQVKAIRRHAAR